MILVTEDINNSFDDTRWDTADIYLKPNLNRYVRNRIPNPRVTVRLMCRTINTTLRNDTSK